MMIQDKKFLLLGLIAILLYSVFHILLVMTRDDQRLKPSPVVSDLEVISSEVHLVSDVLMREAVVDASDLAASSVNVEDELSAVLPDWMIENGSNFEDSREIFGQTVVRRRSRYQWDDGSLMEIEITDIGSEADDSVIQALGFNLSADEQSDESGYRLIQDEDGILSNHEYDYADQAGSLKLFISDRYLVEVQIQNLPEETFQEILDSDIAFDTLFGKLE